MILGEVGQNFGAGMTGGMAFIYDEAGTFALGLIRKAFTLVVFCIPIGTTSCVTSSRNTPRKQKVHLPAKL